MYKSLIILIILILILSLCGCTSTRAIESARNSITELEGLISEQESRNIELGTLLESERESNKELGRISQNQLSELNEYIESERIRSAEKRKILSRLEHIFGKESEIINKLIEGYNEIRKYFEALEVLE